MAGQKMEMGLTSSGLPLVTITEDVGLDDEWGLFRLTDDGLLFYKEGADFRAGIMSMTIADERAVVEIARYKTRTEAGEMRNKLSKEERGRTLIWAVEPQCP